MKHLTTYSYISLAVVLVACSQPTPPPEIQPEIRFNKLGEIVSVEGGNGGCVETSTSPCLPPPPPPPPPTTGGQRPSGGEGGSGASGGGGPTGGPSGNP